MKVVCKNKKNKIYYKYMEKDKKFKNLPSEYKIYLDIINDILKNFDSKKDYTFNEINLLYNSINDVNIKKLIVEKDIERLIKDYEKTNETIYKLRSVLRKRNKEIIRNVLKSEIYKNYINKLSIDYKKSFKEVDEAGIDLIKKYAMTWKCCWSFIEIDNIGVIKKIELFDINDIKFIKEKLKIK